jgi:peptidoglycan L-alanyl-D-glutamate endopeptidase CwlK
VYAITARDERHLKTLYPPFAAKVRKWMELCYEIKLPVHLTSSFRFFGEQDILWQQGKSKARGGESKHNFCLATDFCFDNGEQDGVQNPYHEPFPGAWEKAAIIAKSCGIIAGYFWKTFQDKPHLEAMTESSVDELRSIFIKKNKEGLFTYLDEHCKLV